MAGSTYDGSSAQYTSFFVGWQRRRITKERKEKIVLRRLAHTKSEIDRESV